MAFATARARMRVSMAGDRAGPAVRPGPPRPARPAAASGAWLAAGLAASLCLGGLWTTSAEVLVASELREGGRVLACRYFTGARATERQYLNTGHETDQRACPVVRIG